MATSATGDKLGGIERLSAPPADPVIDELRKTWKPPSGLAALSAVQNDPISKRYFIVTLTLFLVAGLGAMVMRTQLIRPENDLLSPEIYNQIFTMHGTTMMYLVMVPAIGGFATLLMPQILGTRDMPFPRMTQLGFWALLFGTLILYSSVFFGAVPNGGWFVYTPLAEKQYSPGLNSISGCSASALSKSRPWAAQPSLLSLPSRRARSACRSTASRSSPGRCWCWAFRSCSVSRHCWSARPFLNWIARSARASSIRQVAAIRCCGHTCSGFSATRKYTSSSFPPPAWSR